MEAYVEALRRAVFPGATVADIGAGTGIFSLLACRLGASRVYAIDPNPALEIARETAAANGCLDRIEFIPQRSTAVNFDDPVDVIVSDLRGILPYFEQHIPTVADARTRLLRSGGTLIPQRDTLWCALVHAPAEYAELAEPWQSQRYGLDLSPARSFRMNAWVKARFTPEDLLSSPGVAGVLNYSLVTDANFRTELSFTVARNGICHGFCVWFDAELLPGIGFSNAPGAVPALYGSAFFPWLAPVQLSADQQVRVRITARLLDDDYLWRWETTVVDATGANVANFDQSTFWSGPVKRDRRMNAAEYIPTPSEELQLEALILGAINGQRSLGDVAELILDRYPARFRSTAHALQTVGRVAGRYT